METAKIVFSLSGEIADKLRENYEARRNEIQNFCSDDNPEAVKAVARIDNFLANLKTGAELKLDEIQNEDDVDYFVEELIYLIDSILEIGAQKSREFLGVVALITPFLYSFFCVVINMSIQKKIHYFCELIFFENVDTCFL